MINKIKIEGFENYIDSELEFVNGINVITGVSNTGKSSIVKSLNWLINNTPSGDGYINYDLKQSKVTGTFNDQIIEKYKDKNKHYYKINDKDEYTALKQNVPSQVQDITLFSDMNLQSQFDRFFLLQNTPGEVARKLNNIINLSIMDDAIKVAKSKVNQKNRDIKSTQQEVLDLKAEYDTYKWIDDAQKKLDQIEKINKKYEENQYELFLLQSNYDEMQKYKNEINELNNKLKCKKQVTKIKESSKLLFDIDNELNDLKNTNDQLLIIKNDLKIYANVKKYKKTLNSIKLVHEKYEKIEKEHVSLKNEYETYIKIQKSLKKLDHIERFKQIVNKINKQLKILHNDTILINLITEILEYKNKISIFSHDIKKCNLEKKELWDKLDICPLCKQEIK